MPDRGGGPRGAPSRPSPQSKCRRNGGDEQRWVGDASGDDDVRAGFERQEDLVGAEVCVGADVRTSHLADGHAFPQRACPAPQRLRHVVAEQGCDDESVQAELSCDLDGALGRRHRVRDAHVGDHPGAGREGERQDCPHAPFEQRVVAARRIRAHVAVPEREGAFADALEHQRVEPLPRRARSTAGSSRSEEKPAPQPMRKSRVAFIRLPSLDALLWSSSREKTAVDIIIPAVVLHARAPYGSKCFMDGTRRAGLTSADSRSRCACELDARAKRSRFSSGMINWTLAIACAMVFSSVCMNHAQPEFRTELSR